ncbi:hypothetical protein [Pedobacter aquatilis]|uniref:hypothetical protein n=1 Tax=Pedobacter aquatilis TaxID=351343 RepID=UPI00293026AB|nr:hypothetical protein [Pedobacter aquatilis]
MKKSLIFFMLILWFTTIQAQSGAVKFTSVNFEKQILMYNAVKYTNVSEKDYNYGVMILRETKDAVKNNPENLNLADYFNILNAFLTLRETKENIDLAFKKFVSFKGSCEYILAFENTFKSNPKYDVLRADYEQQLSKCKPTVNVKESFDISEYSKSNKLSLSLIETIYQVDVDDQKYRSYDSAKSMSDGQQLLDRKNQAIIDSLYNIHKKYIGRALVGKKFENVMWAVVQHARVEMMERYLPVIYKAVLDKELEVAPLKMLIDRCYGLKYGYQIFGSQADGFGFKLADEKTRREIKAKYGIQ